MHAQAAVTKTSAPKFAQHFALQLSRYIGGHETMAFPRNGSPFSITVATKHSAPTLGPLTAGRSALAESARLVPLSPPTAGGEVHGRTNVNIAPGHYSMPNVTIYRHSGPRGSTWAPKRFEPRFAAYERANINLNTANAFRQSTLPDVSTYKSGYKQTPSLKLIPHRSTARLVNGRRATTPIAFDPYEVTPAWDYPPSLPSFGRLSRSASNDGVLRTPKAVPGAKLRSHSPSFSPSASTHMSASSSSLHTGAIGRSTPPCSASPDAISPSP